MEAVEDSTSLKPQYHKAQQAYSRTQGETYRTIGLLQHYKARVESVEQQVDTLASSWSDHQGVVKVADGAVDGTTGSCEEELAARRRLTNSSTYLSRDETRL
eukprot:Gb_14084 [translate_table: standard]